MAKSSIAKRKYSRTVKYKRGCANVLTQPQLFLARYTKIDRKIGSLKRIYQNDLKM